ncbi:hypothetical protein HWX16_23355 [Ochrobactrum intermedium]|uniref:hypothetical protein n=1 Tax=Brucella intermedia TaxID=94625 RepID=UPI00159CB8B0|nr:hypothetical protein [Brucella intermedia]NVM43221.1 hypothetical protein [Brucella intermedia]
MELRWVTLNNDQRALINPEQIVHIQVNSETTTAARFSDGSVLFIRLTLEQIKQMLDPDQN